MENIENEIRRIFGRTADEIINYFVNKGRPLGIDSEIKLLEDLVTFYEDERKRVIVNNPEDKSTQTFLAATQAVAVNKLREARERKTLKMLKSLQRDVKDIENALRKGGLIA